MCGDMGLFKLEFLAQNLFISSLAVVPIGAALKQRTDDLNRGLPLLISHLSCADAGWCAGHFGPSSFHYFNFCWICTWIFRVWNGAIYCSDCEPVYICQDDYHTGLVKCLISISDQSVVTLCYSGYISDHKLSWAISYRPTSQNKWYLSTTQSPYKVI